MSRTLKGTRALCEWREAKGLTQMQIAELVGTSQTNVSAWLRGRVPRFSMLARLEAVAGIPVRAWLDDDSAA